MSEHDISLVTSQAGSVVAENLKVTLGTQGAGGFSPSQVMAMVGISQGTALKLGDAVLSVKSTLTSIAGNVLDPRRTAAQTALTNLTTLHSNMGFGGTPNHAAFGSFLQQAVQHCKDSVQIKQNVDFISGAKFGDFGSGVKDISSMADRGITNSLGSLTNAGAAIKSSGSLFNGIDIKNFGTSLGLVKSLQNNRLANSTGVNQALQTAGVDINDLDNPVYANAIKQAVSSVNSPTATRTAAEQFGINPPGGLPAVATVITEIVEDPTGDWTVTGESTNTGVLISVNGSSGKLMYSGTPEKVVNSINFLISFNIQQNTTEFNAFYTTLRDTVSKVAARVQASIPPNAANQVQSLADLADVSKTSGTTGFSADSFKQKFSDLGASQVRDASAAGDFWGQFKTPEATPLSNAAAPDLKSMMGSVSSQISAMTGSGNGIGGLPNARDFIQHLSGGPAVTAFNTSSFSVSDINTFNSSIASATSLFSTAGIDLTSPAPNSLGTCMGVASNLKKWGADNTTGVAAALTDMVNTGSKFGESLRTAITEGYNDKLLSKNGIPPMRFNTTDALPTTNGKNENDFWARFTS